MTSTITITHHQTKPEYQWEIVVPEEATLMVTEGGFPAALDALHLPSDGLRRELEALPNGESRSVNVDVRPTTLDSLRSVSVKTL